MSQSQEKPTLEDIKQIFDDYERECNLLALLRPYTPRHTSQFLAMHKVREAVFEKIKAYGCNHE